MKIRSVTSPVSDFRIPEQDMPKAVEAAHAEFVALVGRLRLAQTAVGIARDEVRQAPQRDREAVAANPDVKDAQAHAKAAGSKLADATARRRGLETAVDQAGDKLADAIAAHRDSWLEALSENNPRRRFDAALAEARAATEEYGAVSAALVWLRDFDSEKAHGGRQKQFSGGRLIVPRPRQLTDPLHASALLELVASARADGDTPPPRTSQATAGESRFGAAHA